MYENFEKIDGTHPWREVSEEGYEDYPVQYRAGGRVVYFNYDLAKEMELISKSHLRKMNAKLEKAILKAFSLQILNEHDWIHKEDIKKDYLKDRLYMATRYLQLQHENKQGKTSGDGRSIWNGYIKAKHLTFDVSSCGTGTTILSPGAQEADQYLKTGDESFGYASGLADLDEMLGGAVMSEIFYRSGFPTERCLAVIAYPDRTAVGVRTAPNLIRPAHLFRYLKLGMHKELKLSLDYFLSRQIENKVFPGSYKGKEKYQKSLEYFAKTYAKLCAVMEEEYIFNWLAWDGDNMLASGGILDYGSIRRFAAKHDKYRYEDTDRFSTCLTEQRLEARRIVQTFAQVIDFVITGKKKNLKKFERHQSLRFFDQSFEEEVHNRMLWRMGFEPHQIYKLLTKHPKKVQEFRKVLNYFEGIKSVKGEVKLPDGIDHPPIFLVRHILRELPNFIIQNKDKDRWPIMPPEGFCHVLLASYVDRQDMVLNDTRKQKSLHYQLLFRELIKLVGGDEYQILYKIAERSSVINYENRSTGDGLTWIINEAIKHMDKMKQDEFQETIERFILSQVLTPGEWNPISPGELKGSSMSSRLLRKMHEQLQMYNEMI